MPNHTRTVVIVLAVAIALLGGLAIPLISDDHVDLCEVLENPNAYDGRDITTIGFVARDIESTDAQAFYCRTTNKSAGSRVYLDLLRIGSPKIFGIEKAGKTYWPALVLKGKVSVLQHSQQLILSHGTAQYIGMMDITEPLNGEHDWAWRRASLLMRRKQPVG